MGIRFGHDENQKHHSQVKDGLKVNICKANQKVIGKMLERLQQVLSKHCPQKEVTNWVCTGTTFKCKSSYGVPVSVPYLVKCSGEGEDDSK